MTHNLWLITYDLELMLIIYESYPLMNYKFISHKKSWWLRTVSLGVIGVTTNHEYFLYLEISIAKSPNSLWLMLTINLSFKI